MQCFSWHKGGSRSVSLVVLNIISRLYEMKRYFAYVGEEDIRLVYHVVDDMGQFVSERRFLDDPRKENEEGIKNT